LSTTYFTLTYHNITHNANHRNRTSNSWRDRSMASGESV